MLENVHYNAKNTYFCTLNKESNTFNVNKLPKIDSAALVSEEQDNTSKEVTESLNNKNNSNIDYEEDIDDWFKKMTHRKYFN